MSYGRMGAQLHESREPQEAEPWDFYCEACHCSTYCYDDNCDCECHGRDDETED